MTHRLTLLIIISSSKQHFLRINNIVSVNKFNSSSSIYSLILQSINLEIIDSFTKDRVLAAKVILIQSIIQFLKERIILHNMAFKFGNAMPVF